MNDSNKKKSSIDMKTKAYIRWEGEGGATDHSQKKSDVAKVYDYGMAELSLGTILMAVQAIELEIQALEEEIRELLISTEELSEDDPLMQDLMRAQELHLSYSKASSELEDAYRKGHIGVSNFPSYEELIKRLTRT
jgi:hypothetical protein